MSAIVVFSGGSKLWAGAWGGGKCQVTLVNNAWSAGTSHQLRHLHALRQRLVGRQFSLPLDDRRINFSMYTVFQKTSTV